MGYVKWTHSRMVRVSFGLLVITIITAPILIGCERESERGGSVSPLEDEPMIIDSALALDVVDNRPNGITDTFRPDDSRIYLWIYWIHVEGSHTVRVEWFSPEEGIGEPPYFKEARHFTSVGGEQITWFYLEKPARGFTRGEWEVYVYLDGSFERSYLFYVE